MKHETKILLLSAALAAMMLPAAAQTSTTPTQPTPVPATRKPGEIQERKENQQDRIGEGVENGSLTPAEAGRLEKKDAAINHEVNNMREHNGGKLTPAEKAKVNRQENRVSHQIYRDKHNNHRQHN